MSELENYLDSQGRITEWPSKRNKGRFQQRVLEYLADRFEVGITYSEKEINALLNQYHTFNDPALLRREMVERRLLERTRDGRAYWRTATSDNCDRS